MSASRTYWENGLPAQSGRVTAGLLKSSECAYIAQSCGFSNERLPSRSTSIQKAAASIESKVFLKLR